MHGGDLLVGNQFLGARHVDAIAAEHPHVTLAILEEIEVVAVGELLNRRHLVVRGHVSDGAAGDDPDQIPISVALEAHHNVGRKPVLHADRFHHAVVIEDINTAAIASHENVAVRALRDRKGLGNDNAVLLAVGGDDAAITDHVHAAADRDEDGAILPLADRAEVVGQRSGFRVKGGYLTPVVAQQSLSSPGGEP